MKYIGTRGDRCRIAVQDDHGSSWPLAPRNDLFNHSPDGFEWSYSGSGPAQTALAILASHLQEPAHRLPVLLALGYSVEGQIEVPRGMELHEYLAVRFHQEFKRRLVSNLPKAGWSLTSAKIDETITSWLDQPAKGYSA